MKTTSLLLVIVAASIMISFDSCKPKPANCCTDFESMPFTPDTVFNVVHISIATACGFHVTNENLKIGTNSYFNFARVEKSLHGFGADHVLNMNNVTLLFTSTGTPRNMVTFEYLDLGGTENLSINGVLYIGEISAAPASSVLSGTGVTVAVTAIPIPLPARGKKGIVTLTGAIKSFGVGGQEFYLDNVCSR